MENAAHLVLPVPEKLKLVLEQPHDRSKKNSIKPMRATANNRRSFLWRRIISERFNRRCGSIKICNLLNFPISKTIRGTKYKIHSLFEGGKSFQSLLEELIVTKAAQHKNDQNHDCEEHEIAV